MKQLKLHPRKAHGDNKIELLQWAMVDDEDYDELAKYTWYFKVDNANDPKRKHISVGRQPVGNDGVHLPKSLVLLNRHILHIDDRKILVHFKDKNPLNCQKENLVIQVDGRQLQLLYKHWQENTETIAKLVHSR